MLTWTLLKLETLWVHSAGVEGGNKGSFSDFDLDTVPLTLQGRSGWSSSQLVLAFPPPKGVEVAILRGGGAYLQGNYPHPLTISLVILFFSKKKNRRSHSPPNKISMHFKVEHNFYMTCVAFLSSFPLVDLIKRNFNTAPSAIFRTSLLHTEG